VRAPCSARHYGLTKDGRNFTEKHRPRIHLGFREHTRRIKPITPAWRSRSAVRELIDACRL